jgi:hypothetical protein
MGWNNPTRLSIGGHFKFGDARFLDHVIGWCLVRCTTGAAGSRSVIAASAGSIGRAADCSLDLRIETGQCGG